MQQQALGAGDQAPEITITGADGAPVQLSELWRERPLLLAFLRHYG
jgi:peroxiredoxin